jgi:aminoglycoside phosphotransferase family enzyme
MSDQARPSMAPGSTGRDCGLADKVAWLKSRQGASDESIETHFAWVFLTADRAWKLRKPVQRDTMDYGSLEARRRDSEAEVRLNRRLAPHVYLGTRALTLDAAGRFAIGGEGDVVDWLVEMRRLDRSRMLDLRLARGEVAAGDLGRLVAQLATFYAAERPAVTDGAALAARLRTQVAANEGVLATLDRSSSRTLGETQRAFLAAHPDWLDARAAGGCIVEAHGDLRPEHILLDDPPAVIDCLEFDRNLRILDRAEELEFLALECARLGHAATGERIAAECLAQLGDAVPRALQRFYRSHRAATRAKLYVWRAAEPDDGNPQLWHATAREYLDRAVAAAREAAANATI